MFRKKLQTQFSSGKYPYLKITSKEEIHALFGLLYYRGLYNLNGIRVDVLFSDIQGIPMFSAVMSKNRFCIFTVTAEVR